MAARLGLPFVDTGALYRAATWAVLQSGVGFEDAAAIAGAVADASITIADDGRVFVDGTDVTDEIRGEAVTGAVSAVSAVREVREGLLPLQRQLAGGGGVLEGRDIGTTVFPNAVVKVFLVASPAERARRRMTERGHDDLGAELQRLARRDDLDSARETSPLTMADDAVLVDTTTLTIEQVADVVVDLCRSAGLGDGADGGGEAGLQPDGEPGLQPGGDKAPDKAPGESGDDSTGGRSDG